MLLLVRIKSLEKECFHMFTFLNTSWSLDLFLLRGFPHRSPPPSLGQLGKSQESQESLEPSTLQRRSVERLSLISVAAIFKYLKNLKDFCSFRVHSFLGIQHDPTSSGVCLVCLEGCSCKIVPISTRPSPQKNIHDYQTTVLLHINSQPSAISPHWHPTNSKSLECLAAEW